MADSARIAGWEDRSGEWNNTEKGDPLPDDFEMAESRRIVIAVDVVGEPEPVYFTTSHITEDYNFEEVVYDAEQSGAYGDEFV